MRPAHAKPMHAVTKLDDSSRHAAFSSDGGFRSRRTLALVSFKACFDTHLKR